MNRMMIDIETLGIGIDAVVLTVGAVVFTDIKVTKKVYWELDWLDQVTEGRKVDKSTWAWWRQQNKDAYNKALYRLHESCPTLDALKGLHKLYTSSNCAEIWCQGGSFDIPIIESLISTYGLTPAWRYNQARDSRTLRKILNLREPAFKGTPHHALHDALYQANRVIDCLKHIAGGG